MAFSDSGTDFVCDGHQSPLGRHRCRFFLTVHVQRLADGHGHVVEEAQPRRAELQHVAAAAGQVIKKTINFGEIKK